MAVLKNGFTGETLNSDDIAIIQSLNDTVDKSGNTSASWGGGRAGHLSFEEENQPATGNIFRLYDPEVAAILSGEIA